jgi:predicted ATPase
MSIRTDEKQPSSEEVMPSKRIRIGLVNIGPLKAADIELGRLTVFYGPNGSGKSTVFRALNTAVRIIAGFSVSSAGTFALISNEADTGRISLDGLSGSYEIELVRKARNAVAVKITDKTYGEAKTVSYEAATSGMITPLRGRLGRPPVNVLISVGLSDLHITNVSGGIMKIMTASLNDLMMPPKNSTDINEYIEYIKEVNKVMSEIADAEIAVVDRKLYWKSAGIYFDGINASSGIQRMSLIAAAYTLANRMKKRGASPLLYIENFDAAFHTNLAMAVLNFLSKTEFPTLVEIHNDLILRAALLNQFNYYIFGNGVATKDLDAFKKLWREVQTMADPT